MKLKLTKSEGTEIIQTRRRNFLCCARSNWIRGSPVSYIGCRIEAVLISYSVDTVPENLMTWISKVFFYGYSDIQYVD